MGELWSSDRLASVDAVSPAGLHASWAGLVEGFLDGTEGRDLRAFLGQRLADGVIVYPPDPLRALRLTALDAVRVVIVGQDPYHGPGQAEGLAFSVPPGVRVPPSLRNIHKEVWRDLTGTASPPPAGASGSLVPWAQQGVLLLNTCFTVEEGLPATHAGKGWEALATQVLRACSTERSACVFMLWGNHAQSLLPLIDVDKHLVLQSNHPSPLSAARGAQPFVGNGHFGAANRWLASKGLQEIRWLEVFNKTMA